MKDGRLEIRIGGQKVKKILNGGKRLDLTVEMEELEILEALKGLKRLERSERLKDFKNQMDWKD